ncbi:hypothetical protein NB697_001824 [Xanthomonas sacchari]|uniref:hypothetical protein n=1 Tax=Xanthomonas sacchari TaxID=56458 RepID=UPI00225657B9|nr:hypothetical protein [Xanthomonas sacchari]MCW0378978.1 hypothetical protein [Xanthomonas sacchari]
MPSQAKTPFFLFLGDTDRDGATSKLKATGVEYRKKRLESKVENWVLILEIMESSDLIGTLGKLTNTTYELLSRPEYSEIVAKLLERMKHTPYILFAHESLLTGVPSTTQQSEENDEFFDMASYFSPPSEAALSHAAKLFEEHEIVVTPYKTNAELSVLASSFIDQNEKNLVFRIYIPSGRMWATEAEKLLQLFRDYLNRVSGLRVSHEQYSTKQGVVHEFFADRNFDPSALASEFTQFTETFDLALSEPNRAVALLAARNVDKSTVQGIVDKYSKEARRLHIDLKQERERRLLSIRHRMEEELTDIADPESWNVIYHLIDSSVPTIAGVSSAVGTISRSSASAPSISIDYRPQIIQSVTGIVAQEISGNTQIGPEASQLLEMIQAHGGSRTAELTSSVYELIDPDARKQDRLSAKQKLKAFLIGAGKKLGDVAAGVLQAYIEKQIGL